MEKHTVSASLTDNTKYMNRALPVKKSFDIIERNLIIGGQNSAFYFIDGFTKDETMLKLMDSFLNISADDMPEDATSFSTSCIPYVEVDILGDFDSIFKNLLSGVTCLFIDGYEAAIAIDCRTYPSRSIEEPDKDKSLRGSRDGFVETIVFNTALMRRRNFHTHRRSSLLYVRPCRPRTSDHDPEQTGRKQIPGSENESAISCRISLSAQMVQSLSKI